MKAVAGERSGKAIVTWRREQLARSGFPLPLASAVARDERFDLHALIQLVEQGCAPGLAVRILAPLGRGGQDAA